MRKKLTDQIQWTITATHGSTTHTRAMRPQINEQHPHEGALIRTLDDMSAMAYMQGYAATKREAKA